MSLSDKMKSATQSLGHARKVGADLPRKASALKYVGRPTVPKASLLAAQAAAHARFDYQDSKRPNRAGIASTPVGRDVKNQRPLPEFKPAQIVKGGTSQARRVCPVYQLAQASPAYAEAYRQGLAEAKQQAPAEPDRSFLQVFGKTAEGEPKTHSGRITYTWVEPGDEAHGIMPEHHTFVTEPDRRVYLNKHHLLVLDSEGKEQLTLGSLYDSGFQDVQKVSRHNLVDTTARPALGRNQHISAADLSGWDAKKERELSPFAPYVVIETKIDLAPKPSAMLHCDQIKRLVTSVGVDVLEQMRLERIAQLDSAYRF
jgi:hypothetical protein